MSKPPIIRDKPFFDRGALSGRWYWIESFREYPDGHREAHVKWDVDDAMRAIITDHGGDPAAVHREVGDQR